MQLSASLTSFSKAGPAKVNSGPKSSPLYDKLCLIVISHDDE